MRQLINLNYYMDHKMLPAKNLKKYILWRSVPSPGVYCFAVTMASVLASVFWTSWTQIFTVLSFSIAPEAIMFSVGWQATVMTASVWPSSFWTIFLVWSSHRYTQLSSDPLTMYLPLVMENADEMQYFEFLWPV